MPKALLDWDSVDKSDWGKTPDTVIARRLGVVPQQVAYWRTKAGIGSFNEHYQADRREKASQGLHWCCRCKEYHPKADFKPYAKGLFGLRAECTQSRRQWRLERQDAINGRKRQQYQGNKDSILARNLQWREANRERNRSYMAERLRVLKAKFVQLAGGCCQKCGYAECQTALAFHHINGSNKDEMPVKAILSGNHERAYRELDKCALLCFNCHASYHGGEWSGDFVKREGLGWSMK